LAWSKSRIEYVSLAGSVIVDAALQLPPLTMLPAESRSWAQAWMVEVPTAFDRSWTTSPAWPVNV
jgi:hypothetical protein